MNLKKSESLVIKGVSKNIQASQSARNIGNTSNVWYIFSYFWRANPSTIAQGKIRQNAFGLLVGDFYFGDVETAEIKPLLNRALILTAY